MLVAIRLHMLGKNIYLLAIQNTDYHKDLSSRIKFHGLSLQNGIPFGGGEENNILNNLLMEPPKAK